MGPGIKWTVKKSYWLGGRRGDRETVERKDCLKREMEGKLQFHSPDVGSTGISSLLDSVLLTLLKNWSSDVWVVALSLSSCQCQLYHCCFYACFWTSWAWNKTLYFGTVYITVHKSTTTCRGCIMYVTMYTRNMNQLMWLDIQMHSHFERLQLECSYVGDLQ